MATTLWETQDTCTFFFLLQEQVCTFVCTVWLICLFKLFYKS